MHKDGAATLVEEVTPPTCKVVIKAVKQGLEVRESNFRGSKWQSKVRLGKGGDLAPKQSRHLVCKSFGEVHRDEGTLFKVYLEAREGGESIKDCLKTS